MISQAFIQTVTPGTIIRVWSTPTDVGIEILDQHGENSAHLTGEQVDALVRALATARVELDRGDQ